MSKNQDENLENRIENLSLTNKIIDGMKAIPPIVGCSAFAYLIGFPGCGMFTHTSSDSLNIGQYVAGGSGMYGGYAPRSTRKITSLAVLLASFVPEAIMLAQDGDIKQLGLSAGIKIASYSIGYFFGSLFRRR